MLQIRSLIIQLFKNVGFKIRKHASKTLYAFISCIFVVDFFLILILLNSFMLLLYRYIS